jgi:hypothetical protein
MSVKSHRNVRRLLLITVIAASFSFCFGAGTFTVQASTLEGQTRQADVLQSLGLFQGTENGYELEQSFTRAQGAVMLLRLLGLESQAIEQKHQISPFEDVPASHWASKQLAFAKELGLVRGVSDTEFAPEQSMTGRQYVTLVLRALGYAEAEPDHAAALAAKAGLFRETETARLSPEAGEYARGLMVEVSYHSLTVKLKHKTYSLLQKLVEFDQTVPTEAAVASGLYTKTAPLDPMDRIEQALEKALQE